MSQYYTQREIMSRGNHALVQTRNSFQDYLIKHTFQKQDAMGTQPTNTRIANKASNIYGGSYKISDPEYASTFLPLYYKEVVSRGLPEYLTEAQLSSGGCIAVDLDLHFALDHDAGRVYTIDHLNDLVEIYLGELKEIFQFDSETAFQIYIFEKEHLNRVEAKNMTKDGIHVIIGLQADRTVQQLLRKRVMPLIAEAWGDFPLINQWSDVFDEGISIGYTNWQLYGSRKPLHEPYKLTQIYDITVDGEDGEPIWKPHPARHADWLSVETFPKLSVRYRDHPVYFFKNMFLAEYNKAKAAAGGGAGTSSAGAAPRPVSRLAGSGMSAQDQTQLRLIRNSEDMRCAVDRFLESLGQTEYVMRETYGYTMALPVSYYGEGSYSKWIRVGWALRNFNDRMLVAWLAFSAKSPTFDYSTISDLCDMWLTFKVNAGNGFTERSIMYWAKQDARKEFDEVHMNSVSYAIDRMFDKIKIEVGEDKKSSTNGRCGDFDIAQILHYLYKDQYVCVSIKANIWYQFVKNRWVEIDSGTTLRKAISIELRDLFQEKAQQLFESATHVEPENDKHKMMQIKAQKILDICSSLARTNDKKNIMTEAKELFWDPLFLNKMDNNPYLLCFNNGVFDFENKEFREGKPEDYLTKTTNLDYNQVDPVKDAVVVAEIEDFMHKLFPVADLNRYMWDHLASTLIGTSSVNQTFNMYIGDGQNGKSVLTDLMGRVLGTYKVAVPVSLLTQPRGRIGGLAPEVVAMKGTRYAVMQESNKGEKIYEAQMKELVSGVEPIKARSPYMLEPVEFVPQFKLVLCSNEFMEIKSRDHGTWRRIRVVDFMSLFTENPVEGDIDKPYQYLLDRELVKKFPAWQEVFASMLVQRAVETGGLVKDCPMVMASSNSYREKQDYIAEFLRDRIAIDAGGHVRKTQLAEEFKVWYQQNYGTRNPSPKDMYEQMNKRYGREKNGLWSGIRIKFDDMGGEVPEISPEEDFDDGIDVNDIRDG